MSTWPALAALVAWLDKANGTSETETVMRLLKVTAEAGEVADAYAGMTGQNPRKGRTHSREDVAAELCDVALTALVALHSFTDDPEATFREHLAKVAARVGVADPASASEPVTVPDQWLRAAAIEAYNDGRNRLEDFDGDELEFLSDGIAGVIPCVRADERARIVEDIRAFTRDPDRLAAWCEPRRLGAGAGAGAVLLTIAREIEAGEGHA